MENLTLIKKIEIKDNESVVLYIRRITKDIKEFITWIENKQGERYWGHYFMSLEVALEDFNKRLEANK